MIFDYIGNIKGELYSIFTLEGKLKDEVKEYINKNFDKFNPKSDIVKLYYCNELSFKFEKPPLYFFKELSNIVV